MNDSGSICDRFAPLRFRVEERGGVEWASIGELCELLGLEVEAQTTELREQRGHWATVAHVSGVGPCIPLGQVPMMLCCIDVEDVPAAKAALLGAVHRNIGAVLGGNAKLREGAKELLEDGERIRERVREEARIEAERDSIAPVIDLHTGWPRGPKESA